MTNCPSKPPQLNSISQSLPQSQINPFGLSPKKYNLVWSNPNPYTVSFEVDSKINMATWNIYATGKHNGLSETNVQIYPTNKSEIFRVGFSQ